MSIVCSGEYLTSLDNSIYMNTKSVLVLLRSPYLAFLGGSQTTLQVKRRQFLHEFVLQTYISWLTVVLLKAEMQIVFFHAKKQFFPPKRCSSNDPFLNHSQFTFFQLTAFWWMDVWMVVILKP